MFMSFKLINQILMFLSNIKPALFYNSFNTYTHTEISTIPKKILKWLHTISFSIWIFRVILLRQGKNILFIDEKRSWIGHLVQQSEFYLSYIWSSPEFLSVGPSCTASSSSLLMCMLEPEAVTQALDSCHEQEEHWSAPLATTPNVWATGRKS